MEKLDPAIDAIPCQFLPEYHPNFIQNGNPVSREVGALENYHNGSAITVNWRFRPENARKMLKPLYPLVQRRCGRLIFKGLSVFLPPANLAFSLDLSGSA